MRQVAPQKETVYALYVLDKDGKLVGVVSLQKLLLSGAETRVSDFMYPKPISLAVDADQEIGWDVEAHADVSMLRLTVKSPTRSSGRDALRSRAGGYGDYLQTLAQQQSLPKPSDRMLEERLAHLRSNLAGLSAERQSNQQGTERFKKRTHTSFKYQLSFLPLTHRS